LKLHAPLGETGRILRSPGGRVISMPQIYIMLFAGARDWGGHVNYEEINRVSREGTALMHESHWLQAAVSNKLGRLRFQQPGSKIGRMGGEVRCRDDGRACDDVGETRRERLVTKGIGDRFGPSNVVAK